MQAPTVAESPQIQALEPARPDQPKNDDRGFARALERSLAPARRERPTQTQDQEPDKPTAVSADVPAPSVSPPTEIPADAASIAIALSAVALPALAIDVQPTLPLTNQVPVALGPDLTAGAIAPAIALPTVDGAAFPLVSGPVPAAASTKAQPNTAQSEDALALVPVLPATVPTVAPDNALADDAHSTPIPIPIPAAATSAAPAAPVSGVAQAATAAPTTPVAPTAPSKTRNAPATNTLPSDGHDASALDITTDDAAAPLSSISPAVLSPVIAAVPLSSPVAISAAKPMTDSDNAAAAPLVAMPQTATTPTTPPVTSAGAALGNQTKVQTDAKNFKNTKDEGVPLDLQAKATSAVPNVAPTTATANAPAATAGTREAAPAATPPPPEPNPMERAVAQQIGRALVQHLPNGERMMVLRLTPPELGTVRIELIERQGVMSARLHAEDDGVRLALERTLPQMRQELRASDAPIRELTLTDQSQFQRPDSQDQTQRQQDQQAERRQRNGEGFSLDVARSEPLAAPRSRDLGIRVDANGINALA